MWVRKRQLIGILAFVFFISCLYVIPSQSILSKFLCKNVSSEERSNARQFLKENDYKFKINSFFKIWNNGKPENWNLFEKYLMAGIACLR